MIRSFHFTDEETSIQMALQRSQSWEGTEMSLFFLLPSALAQPPTRMVVHLEFMLS